MSLKVSVVTRALLNTVGKVVGRMFAVMPDFLFIIRLRYLSLLHAAVASLAALDTNTYAKV